MFKSLLFSGALVLAALAFPTSDAAAAGPEDCSTNGFCAEICGPAGNYGCTYADCGSGTQLCTRR